MTTTATFGCDRCGQPREAHDGERATCPGQGKHAYATYVESRWGNDDGHRLAIVFRYGEPYPKIVHPESGCPALLCGRCREDAGEEPDEDCPECGGSGVAPSGACWLDHFLGETGREWWELTRWVIEFEYVEPVPILWRGGWDDFEWRPRDACASDDQHGTGQGGTL